MAGRSADRSALDFPTVPLADEYVCWSRMQSEAGQPLECIIERKELERRAGDGLFMWGVGNAPAALTRALARIVYPVRVVFSVMKSKPKACDVSPTRTLLWRRYLDAQGVERPLPPHVIVTSRGACRGEAKRAHYALMCRSDLPLCLTRGGPNFDPSAYRNASGTGAPVGSSQVTALLRRITNETANSGYEVNLSAWLTGSYWVRLTDPVEVSASKRLGLGGARNLDVEGWLDLASVMREGSKVRDVGGETGFLF